MRFVLFLGVALAACSPAPPKGEPPPPAPSTPAQAEGIVVETPSPNARLESPINVRGVAPNDWYFEAVFDAQLVGADGAVIAESFGQAQTDWMAPGPVPFVATFTFDAKVGTPAEIVLTEDTSGEKPNPRSVRIPVTLLPTP